MSTQTAQAGNTETTSTAPVKRQKITERIVAHLKKSVAEKGEKEGLQKISDLYSAMSDVERGTLQATLSQLVKAGKVEKVKTGERQPSYRVPAPASAQLTASTPAPAPTATAVKA